MAARVALNTVGKSSEPYLELMEYSARQADWQAVFISATLAQHQRCRPCVHCNLADDIGCSTPASRSNRLGSLVVPDGHREGIVIVHWLFTSGIKKPRFVIDNTFLKHIMPRPRVTMHETSSPCKHLLTNVFNETSLTPFKMHFVAGLALLWHLDYIALPQNGPNLLFSHVAATS